MNAGGGIGQAKRIGAIVVVVIITTDTVQHSMPAHTHRRNQSLEVVKYLTFGSNFVNKLKLLAFALFVFSVFKVDNEELLGPLRKHRVTATAFCHHLFSTFLLCVCECRLFRGSSTYFNEKKKRQNRNPVHSHDPDPFAFELAHAACVQAATAACAIEPPPPRWRRWRGVAGARRG